MSPSRVTRQASKKFSETNLGPLEVNKSKSATKDLFSDFAPPTHEQRITQQMTPIKNSLLEQEKSSLNSSYVQSKTHTPYKISFTSKNLLKKSAVMDDPEPEPDSPPTEQQMAKAKPHQQNQSRPNLESFPSSTQSQPPVTFSRNLDNQQQCSQRFMQSDNASTSRNQGPHTLNSSNHISVNIVTDSEANRFFQLAQKFQAESNYSVASEFYQKCLQLNPDFTTAAYAQANCLCQMGVDDHTVVRAYQNALQQDTYTTNWCSSPPRQPLQSSYSGSSQNQQPQWISKSASTKMFDNLKMKYSGQALSQHSQHNGAASERM